jgi:hypothetical protein
MCSCTSRIADAFSLFSNFSHFLILYGTFMAYLGLKMFLSSFKLQYPLFKRATILLQQMINAETTEENN